MAATSSPAATPPITPKPISSSGRGSRRRGPRDLGLDVSGRSAANSSGTQIPSLSPLSTFSPWRMRGGTRGSVTTAWPRAASVDARITQNQGLADRHLPEDRRAAARSRREARSSAAREADPEQA